MKVGFRCGLIPVHIIILMLIGLFACNNSVNRDISPGISAFTDVLDYKANPDSPYDRNWLAFSDQGAWFAYGFPDTSEKLAGFAGPFIMTQENGIWSSKSLSKLKLTYTDSGKEVCLSDFKVTTTGNLSHLEQKFSDDEIDILQSLFYVSPQTSFFVSGITNKGNKPIQFNAEITGDLLSEYLNISSDESRVYVDSDKSDARGTIQVFNNKILSVSSSDTTYSFILHGIELAPDSSIDILISQTFTFREMDIDEEQDLILSLTGNYDEFRRNREGQKFDILNKLKAKTSGIYNSSAYSTLLAKSVLTLQNNWRVPAGELRYSGLFPSYHYIWFHGFWAWDSWKHAVALTLYDPVLAKDQIRAMYDFMDDKGFIADCIYRDTTIENHNYRNTKPPLSAWAVWKVFESDYDTSFLQEMYPKILKQHNWWYKHRDHDSDGLCEYGSSDGTLIAAKWESGMDNAVRFDNSKLLKNSENAYSLDQESVDLNSYLYAEKLYIRSIASILGKEIDADKFGIQAKDLGYMIRNQFYDSISGWFFDTSINGKNFTGDMGCEGWIPLWAEVADKGQAENVMKNMMDTLHFNTCVPLQTLSASHSKFKPDRGYWRGPTWLDQAYFGVCGLRYFGFDMEADSLTMKLLHNAEGLLEKGSSIRENYNPITGEGLESENFSWSAAHYLLLLTEN